MNKRATPIVALIMFSMLVMMFPMGNVSAITGNYTDDAGRHPYVGLVVVDVIDPETGEPVPAWRGTGILISSTVVLTAGHLTEGAVAARVWFNEGPILSISQGGDEYPYSGDESYDGRPYLMEGFGYYLNGNGAGDFITNDIGIVVLTEEVPLSVVSEYGELPDVGEVDELRVKTPVDLVGYGVQYQVTPRNDGGPYNAWRGDKMRHFATANLLSGNFAWSDEFLRVSANAANGKGGTSFGDSGGPVLLGGTNTILGVTSYGTNSNSAGTGYYQRVDIPEVLAWINTFL